MVMGTVNFAVNLLTRKQNKPPKEEKINTPCVKSSDDAQVDIIGPGGNAKGALEHTYSSAAADSTLGNVQSAQCPPHQAGYRLSHDSILESAWYGTSDPSLSGRASLDGGQGSSAVGGNLDCDASSLPCCSIRGSLDGSLTGGGSTPRKELAGMGQGMQAFLTRSSAQAVLSPRKLGPERSSSRPAVPASPLRKPPASGGNGPPAGVTCTSQTETPADCTGSNAHLDSNSPARDGQRPFSAQLLAETVQQAPPLRSSSGSDVRAGSRGSLDSKASSRATTTAPRDCSRGVKQPKTVSATSTVEFWPGASSCPAGGLLAEASSAASFLAAAAASPQRRRDPELITVSEGSSELASPGQRPRPNTPLLQQDHHHHHLQQEGRQGQRQQQSHEQSQDQQQEGQPCLQTGTVFEATTQQHAQLADFAHGHSCERGAASSGPPCQGVPPELHTIPEGGQGQQGRGQMPPSPPNLQLLAGASSDSLDSQLPLEVHGTYGCHFMTAAQKAASGRGAKEPCVRGRSSIDLLLEPLPPAAITRRSGTEHPELWPSRLSMDSTESGRAGGPNRRSLNLLSMASMAAPGPRGSRHSIAAAPFRTPQARSRLEGNAMGAGSFVDLAAAEAALGMPHAASTNMLGGLSAGEMMSCNSPCTPADGGGGASPFAQGTTASAFASSVVDTSTCCQEGPSDPAAPPQELWLDPDLHDTFGAHAIMSTASSGTLGLERHPAPRNSAGSPRMHQSLTADPAFRPMPNGDGCSTAAARLAPAPAGTAPQRALPVGGLVLRPPPPPTAVLDPSPFKPTSMLDPSTVYGQHSITVQDPQHSVPSLEFLRARRAARERLEKSGSSGGGYIAEAKRVLSQAMNSADPLETLMVQSSQSGAIGPLLRHLSLVKHDDDALRAGLHTLSLIISNSPNKGIIISFKGQQMLFEILCASQDLQVQQDIVQLLWDLESDSEGSTCRACVPEPKCLSTFLGLLERTQSASIASHVIHFMFGFREMQVEGTVLADVAHRLVGVVRSYRYHLQDAAQYTLGMLFKEVLVSPRLEDAELRRVVQGLLSLLESSRHVAQCEATLSILSCIAAAARCRAALCGAHARSKLLQLGQHVADPRLRARALSLVKVLNKQQLGEGVA